MTEVPKANTEPLTASEYIREMFEPSDTIAVLTRNRERGETIQRITKAERVAGPEFQAWLRYKNASGSDIYIGMNPLKEGASTRTKDEVETIRHLYLDLDRDGAAALAAIRNSALVPPPNYVLDTSPGKHQVVWKVAEVSQDEAEVLQKAMAREFGGDPAATDSTRVLRLPGFANKKYGADYYVQVHGEANRTYHRRDFNIQPDPPGGLRHRDEIYSRARPQPGAPKIQSERDWAYAMRALARSDDPEEVTRRIADYRAQEKPNPQYYARHTVDKAVAALNARETTQATSDPTEPPRARHERGAGR